MTDTENTEPGNAIGSTSPTVEDRAHWTPEMWAEDLEEKYRRWALLDLPSSEFESWCKEALTDAIRGYHAAQEQKTRLT